MGQYSSYYLYQKYEKRGEQDWIPVYPNTYSISGDSENPMSLSLKMECDVNCGCQEAIYRWVNLDPSVAWICDGTTKYYKQQRQVSYDNGTTWISLEEYQRGALIETSSSDCGEPIYEWNLVSGFICDDCNANKVVVGVSADTFEAQCSTSTTLTSAEIDSLTARTAIEWATIGNCVETIGAGAFSGCTSMDFCRIPNSVKTIGNSAFLSSTTIVECSLPSGIETIGENAFRSAISLAYINLPNSVTTVGNYAFRDCLNFRYINIPNSLTSIPEGCFYNCDGLSDIELHSGITSIGANAFRNCSGLYTIILHNTVPPTLGSNALTGVGSNLKIYVPAESLEIYKATSGWSNYANNIYAIE